MVVEIKAEVPVALDSQSPCHLFQPGWIDTLLVTQHDQQGLVNTAQPSNRLPDLHGAGEALTGAGDQATWSHTDVCSINK